MNEITLTINGKKYSLPSKPGEMLAALLRERLNLTGTKIGCEEAECGACTVLINGEPVLSCIYPAERANGKEIVRITATAMTSTAEPTLATRSRRRWPRRWVTAMGTSTRNSSASPLTGSLHPARRGAVRILHSGTIDDGLCPA